MAHSKTFYLTNGKSFSSAKSLAKELISMSSEVYHSHVNQHKNDFENWVKNSLKKGNLAKKIEGHISKIELELEVLRHLVHDSAKKAVKKKAVSKKKK